MPKGVRDYRIVVERQMFDVAAFGQEPTTLPGPDITRLTITFDITHGGFYLFQAGGRVFYNNNDIGRIEQIRLQHYPPDFATTESLCVVDCRLEIFPDEFSRNEFGLFSISESNGNLCFDIPTLRTIVRSLRAEARRQGRLQ